MAIVKGDLVWRESKVMNGGYELGGIPDTTGADAANGGLMTPTQIVGGAKNGIMPDAPQSELTNGSIVFRKAFIHVSNPWSQATIEANGGDLQLVQPRVFVETRTTGEDSAALFLGDQLDVQAALTGTEPLFGGAKLNADASAGATSITVNVEDDEDGVPLNIFRVGQLVRISDKADVEAAGSEEFVTLTAVSAFTGNVQTLTWAAGDALTNAYLASATKVASAIEPATIVSTFDNVTAPTGAGTFGGNIFVNNLGCVEDTWTVLFDSATTYTVSGLNTGALAGSGSTAADFSPGNADFGTSPPYFVIKGGQFTGTWAATDSFTFQTHPASIPLWYRRMIKPGSNSISINKVIVGITAQSS